MNLLKAKAASIAARSAIVLVFLLATVGELWVAMTPEGKEWKPLKDTTAAWFGYGHHWTAKGVLEMLLFGGVYFLYGFFGKKELVEAEGVLCSEMRKVSEYLIVFPTFLFLFMFGHSFHFAEWVLVGFVILPILYAIWRR